MHSFYTDITFFKEKSTNVEELGLEGCCCSCIQKHKRNTSTTMYKFLNDLAPQYLSDLFVRLSDFHIREQRSTKNDLAVLLMRTRGQIIFSYHGTKLWNKLNNNIKDTPYRISFKSRLRQLGYENPQFCR